MFHSGQFRLDLPTIGSPGKGEDDANIQLADSPRNAVGPGGGLFQENDPQPTVHPDQAVIGITGASASDTTFSAPGVTGCGPGGANDIAVDEALNASSGLPAASGNSLTLSGQFLLSDNDAASDQLLPQPQDPAADMLAAFKAAQMVSTPSSTRSPWLRSRPRSTTAAELNDSG